MAYQIIWKGTPNFTEGRSLGKPVAIVDHIMAGTMEGSDKWLRNPQSQASAHFGIAKDGRIWQWVKETDSAWSNGIVNKPNLAIGWLAKAIADGQWINALTISIEHEGQPGDTFTEAQYQATLWLHRKLIAAWNIPVDSNHIIKHADIDGVNRPYCPGPNFPFKRLFADLQQQPPSAPTQLGNPIAGADGQQYWVVGAIRQFYDNNKWLGLPLTGEKGAQEGGYSWAGTFQWFQRGRVEFHEGSGVMLGLVGSELLAKG